ncbi:hypothetical protein HYH03_003632 [Edaphochlamys debaryana]|uniref:Ribonuclease H1 N-terminal domain-containing protein n=1 Tax=Edaphochlamys debaryana TaxID=47281 RepID=A0A836C405_9CHLO|nr:hypothetical protein HYH03_003632 [Edaphochlamys debaryana]|eukprot:KAG2498373.1 hypothetical protein HYH03_003632 [Edaphochlamys debaryana]
MSAQGVLTSTPAARSMARMPQLPWSPCGVGSGVGGRAASSTPRTASRALVIAGARRKWYAVAQPERFQGIYCSWAAVRDLVQGHSGHEFQGFPTEAAALEWLKEQQLRLMQQSAGLEPLRQSVRANRTTPPGPPSTASTPAAGSDPATSNSAPSASASGASTQPKRSSGRRPWEAPSQVMPELASVREPTREYFRKWYAVRFVAAEGGAPAVYTSWQECQEAIRGAPYAEHRSFGCLHEARVFAFGDSVTAQLEAEEAALAPPPALDNPAAVHSVPVLEAAAISEAELEEDVYRLPPPPRATALTAAREELLQSWDSMEDFVGQQLSPPTVAQPVTLALAAADADPHPVGRRRSGSGGGGTGARPLPASPAINAPMTPYNPGLPSVGGSAAAMRSGGVSGRRVRLAVAAALGDAGDGGVAGDEGPQPDDALAGSSSEWPSLQGSAREDPTRQRFPGASASADSATSEPAGSAASASDSQPPVQAEASSSSCEDVTVGPLSAAADGASAASDPAPKRGRGRPRKAPLEPHGQASTSTVPAATTASASTSSSLPREGAPLQRGRGRPRKTPLPEPASPESAPSSSRGAGAQASGLRGEPRSERQLSGSLAETSAGPKRGRGRPPKSAPAEVAPASPSATRRAPSRAAGAARKANGTDAGERLQASATAKVEGSGRSRKPRTPAARESLPRAPEALDQEPIGFEELKPDARIDPQRSYTLAYHAHPLLPAEPPPATHSGSLSSSDGASTSAASAPASIPVAYAVLLLDVESKRLVACPAGMFKVAHPLEGPYRALNMGLEWAVSHKLQRVELVGSGLEPPGPRAPDDYTQAALTAFWATPVARQKGESQEAFEDRVFALEAEAQAKVKAAEEEWRIIWEKRSRPLLPPSVQPLQDELRRLTDNLPLGSIGSSNSREAYFMALQAARMAGCVWPMVHEWAARMTRAAAQELLQDTEAEISRLLRVAATLDARPRADLSLLALELQEEEQAATSSHSLALFLYAYSLTGCLEAHGAPDPLQPRRRAWVLQLLRQELQQLLDGPHDGSPGAAAAPPPSPTAAAAVRATRVRPSSAALQPRALPRVRTPAPSADRSLPGAASKPKPVVARAGTRGSRSTQPTADAVPAAPRRQAKQLVTARNAATCAKIKAVARRQVATVLSAAAEAACAAAKGAAAPPSAADGAAAEAASGAGPTPGWQADLAEAEVAVARVAEAQAEMAEAEAVEAAVLAEAAERSASLRRARGEPEAAKAARAEIAKAKREAHERVRQTQRKVWETQQELERVLASRPAVRAAVERQQLRG